MLGHGWTEYRRKGRELFIAEKVRDTDSKTGKVLIGFCSTPRTGVVSQKKTRQETDTVARRPEGRSRDLFAKCLPVPTAHLAADSHSSLSQNHFRIQTPVPCFRSSSL